MFYFWAIILSYSCHFGEKACRHVNVCPGIMIFNKSSIVLIKYSAWPAQAQVITIKHFTYKMKTFAVNNPVIFVTEVIFLGIYCMFFFLFCFLDHETHAQEKILHLPMNFLVRIKEEIQNKYDRSRGCLKTISSDTFWKFHHANPCWIHSNSFIFYDLWTW